MEKLILIDGNSLLNRAYYAMTIFTTRGGQPTNGIFGFVRLLFKIIEDEAPEYLAVAFDLPAPTFRHLMYDGYKGTRKPMPEDLVVQVPVLKDLLHTMNIRTVERSGYEADDLIGTMTRKFPQTSVLIYTGDRDAYQLVRENVDVCFTKRGVSNLDRLTAENFYEKVGLTPAQIVEEKALMGDASDNIPGVKGVGLKGATELLHRYGDLDGVYAHLDEIKGALHTKLKENRQTAYLSKRLATIDVNVPLELELEDCALTIPFSEEARERFLQLEFRSLIDSRFFPEMRPRANELPPTVVCTDLPLLMKAVEHTKEFALSVEKEGVYLAFNGQDYLLPLRENILSKGFFFTELKPLFELLFSPGKRAILCDVKEFSHMMDGIGVEIACEAEDVSLVRYLCDSNRRPATAKELAAEYGISDRNCATALLMSWQDGSREIEGSAEEKLYRELELPLETVLLDMERTGIAVDLEKFPVFSDKFKSELSELSARIYELAGGSFNLNSPIKLSAILFDRMGIDHKGIKKNAKGGYSTSAEVLEKLAEEHEIARLILRYRELQKLQSSYIDGILPLAAGGIVHTTYNQTITTTGRLSSANPNLQNIPIRTEAGREIRKLFIAREGNLLVDADYSQIELRLLAHFSDCKALKESYLAGEDVHATTAAQIYAVPLDKVTDAMRRRAKIINFGIIYGMSSFGLGKDLGCSALEAQTYITKYFETHHEVKEYMEENVRLARENGFVTTVLGRKRYIPEIKSTNYTTRTFGERAAMNMPLQGSAADIIKLAMLRVDSRLRKEGMRTKLVLQVHDELVLDAPEEEAERAAKLLKEEMEHAIPLNVPLIAEVSVGKSWYDAK